MLLQILEGKHLLIELFTKILCVKCDRRMNSLHVYHLVAVEIIGYYLLSAKHYRAHILLLFCRAKQFFKHLYCRAAF